MDTISINQAVSYLLINREKNHVPWLIMVHGFTHNSSYFSAQIPVFEQAFRLCLIDLRGHGKSSDMPGPFGVEEYADDILAVMDAANIKKAHYWGTHTGSAIGLIMALRQPHRFASLILEGTFLPGFPMPRVGELIERARSIAQSKGIPAALEDWFNHADWFDYINEHPQTGRAEELRTLTYDFSGIPWLSQLLPRPVCPVADHLSEIKPPALVYNGQDDLDDFKSAADYLANNLLNVQQEIIPNAGGFPGWENPAAVNQLVQHFLSNQTP